MLFVRPVLAQPVHIHASVALAVSLSISYTVSSLLFAWQPCFHGDTLGHRTGRQFSSAVAEATALTSGCVLSSFELVSFSSPLLVVLLSSAQFISCLGCWCNDLFFFTFLIVRNSGVSSIQFRVAQRENKSFGHPHVNSIQIFSICFVVFLQDCPVCCRYYAVCQPVCCVAN